MSVWKHLIGAAGWLFLFWAIWMFVALLLTGGH
jgi:hypothetical protein